MNHLKARAKLGERTTKFHAASIGLLDEPTEESFTDILVDLMHFATSQGIDFFAKIDSATRAANEEQRDPELTQEEHTNPNSCKDIRIVAGRINGADEDSVFLLEGDETLSKALGCPEENVNCTFDEPLLTLLDEKR